MSEAPGAWKYYVTGGSDCSQQSSNLKGDGYNQWLSSRCLVKADVPGLRS